MRKDFIISEYQVWESFQAGADAILLIADILESEILKDLHALASELGLHILLEAHDEKYFKLFEEIKPEVIGVNCRNLQTMAVDIDSFNEKSSQLPKNLIWVAESGISNSKDLEYVFDLGFDAALVGSHLMGSVDPGIALANLLRYA